jgi:asparagine synthase (glutamine-hydrolysing)
MALAADQGANHLLTGSLGNLTLHFGGLQALPMWLAHGQFSAWLKQARASAARDDASWRGVLFNSFGPWLPDWLWRNLRQHFLGIERTTLFVRPEVGVPKRPGRLPSSVPQMRLQLMRQLDPGMILKASEASGINELDPFADRDLIEFSLRLPSDCFLDAGVFRPLAQQALADRLPMEVLNSRTRGIQSADWYYRIDRAECRNALEEIQACGSAAAILDVGHIGHIISRWPGPDCSDPAEVDLYSRKLPIALAMGIFMKETESSGTSG